MKDIPQKIYLQIGMEDNYEDEVESFKEFTEVTWCSDKMHDSDIEYRLAVPTKEDDVLTEISDNFRCVAHNYKDGKFDYRTIWKWFQDLKNDYSITKKQVNG